MCEDKEDEEEKKEESLFQNAMELSTINLLCVSYERDVVAFLYREGISIRVHFKSEIVAHNQYMNGGSFFISETGSSAFPITDFDHLEISYKR